MSARDPIAAVPPPRESRARQHIALRLDAPTVARVDALIPSLCSSWYAANRSDVMRALVMEALPILERRAARRPG